ncbi:hypothetical protein FOA52_000973 [Chlamydomonas sp. UWO 241]|nr:hypothetical protein FOA52_000973 [Chlamydomonas sp. UWO 241]
MVKTNDVLVGDDWRGTYCFVRVTRTTTKTVFAQTLKEKVSFPPTDAGHYDSRYREFEPVTPFEDDVCYKPLKLRWDRDRLRSGSSKNYTDVYYKAWDGIPVRAQRDHD